MQERLEWLDNNGYMLPTGDIITTRTTKFLMPLIGVSEEELDNHCLKMFINSHITNKEEMTICLILNKLDYPEECIAYVILQNLNENFIRYIEEVEEYILEYKIPEHFREDFNMIIEGKYSKTSKVYKNIMTKVHKIRKDDSDHLCYVYEVLYPTTEKMNKLADRVGVDTTIIRELGEVSSKPDMNYEIYRNIKQLKTDGFGTKSREN